jgi:hypothetical protein
MGAAVITHGDAAPVFDAAAHVLDAMALAVQYLVVGIGLSYYRSRNAGDDANGDEGFAEAAAVVALLAEQFLGPPRRPPYSQELRSQPVAGKPLCMARWSRAKGTPMLEIKANVATYLKARTEHSSSLPEIEKLVMPVGSAVRATEITEEASYWRLTGPTIGGVPVKAGVHLALKAHWTRPIEVEETDPTRSQALQLFQDGRSISYIAKTLKIGRSQIKRWVEEASRGNQ